MNKNGHKKTRYGENHTWCQDKKTDSMYSFTVTHESRNLKQARPDGQYVDLLHKRFALATPSQQL